ncbi:MAG: exodeoxyribonuclease V subunit gamma [Sandaracinus sp.]|nr:exodeoxyribonuclease V subunit gamma [Sandaracinus sp.]
MTVRLVYSQRTEALVEALAEAIELRRAQRGPLEPFHVVVPSRNLERHLTLALAERQGIVANLRFHRLERFVGRWLQRERIDVARVLDRRSLEAFVLRALLDDAWLAQVEAASLARYVGEEPGIARDRRRTELALRLARLLEGYAYSRPEMLRAWDRGELVDASDATERWQAFAWRQVRDSASKERIVSLHEALGRIRGVTPVPGALPSELHVVGLSYVARIFQWVFGAMGERTELVLHVLNPCREFWEDVPAATELRADPEEALRERDDDPPLLTWWGRPGREHVHLLNELTSGDFEERFVEVEPTTVLETVQRDVLDRRVGPDARASADGTIEAFACPGVRREVEVVAESIWRLVRQSDANDPLRFHEIAVLVHAEDRDTYLPHVAAVFGEAQRIPHHVVDLSLQSESRVVEAAGLLVDVLLSRFARPEVLALLRHPALRVPGAPNELDRAAWVRLVDRLGVFHGRDGADLEGTYLAPETLGVEAVTWAQGASRLALGAFLESETDASPFVGPFGPMHPEPGEGDEATPALALLVRSRSPTPASRRRRSSRCGIGRVSSKRSSSATSRSARTARSRSCVVVSPRAVPWPSVRSASRKKRRRSACTSPRSCFAKASRRSVARAANTSRTASWSPRSRRCARSPFASCSCSAWARAASPRASVATRSTCEGESVASAT